MATVDLEEMSGADFEILKAYYDAVGTYIDEDELAQAILRLVKRWERKGYNRGKVVGAFTRGGPIRERKPSGGGAK